MVIKKIAEKHNEKCKTLKKIQFVLALAFVQCKRKISNQMLLYLPGTYLSKKSEYVHFAFYNF